MKRFMRLVIVVKTFRLFFTSLDKNNYFVCYNLAKNLIILPLLLDCYQKRYMPTFSAVENKNNITVEVMNSYVKKGSTKKFFFTPMVGITGQKNKNKRKFKGLIKVLL